MAHIRLQKILASAGFGSRRKAEELVASGAVTVNGRTATLGDAADPEIDEIRVHGRRLTVPTQRRYIALNKPRGYVSSLRSTHGEQTVIELAPGDGRLFPVGRLDKDTSGLLLLTDDGDWSNLVTHPRYGVVKEYRALVRGRPSPAALERMRRGVPLPDGTLTAPASVEHIGEDGGDSWLSIAVIEGKKRQIRLMAREVGHPVVALQRVRIGPITLDMLPEGSWRELTAEEVEALRDVARRGFDRGRTPTGRTG